MRLINQLILSVSIGSIIISAIIYFYFIYNQNKLYQDYFIKNTRNISEVLKLSIELGASNEQYDALMPVFEWAMKDSSLEYIFLFDQEGELMVNYPFDLDININRFISDHEKSGMDDSLYFQSNVWKAKFGNGKLITVFSTRQLTTLKNQAITNLSTSMIVVSLISVMFFSFLAMGITKPLRRLVEGAEIIAEGDETFRVACETGSIEIKTVSKAFNNMLDRLTQAQSQRLLEANNYNKLLEDKNNKLVELHNEKNEFLGIVAHDLKNPIAAIVLYTEIIKLNFSKMTKDDVLASMTKIETTSKAMTNLLKDLLDINALESGLLSLNLESSDICTFVVDASESFSAMAKNKNINIETSVIDSLIVETDFSRIKQIIDNLVSNAIKFSPKEKTVYLRCFEMNGRAVIEVEDEGPGIKSEEMVKLFGKFNRLSARPTGNESSTGLGLSIAKKLTELMDGNIWCESEFGKGAKFCLSLNLTKTDNE